MLSTNLLPSEKRTYIRLAAARRMAIFFAALAVAASAVGIVLLVPSYLSYMLERRELELRLAVAEEGIQKLDVADWISRLQQTKAAVAAIRSFTSVSGRLPALIDFFTTSHTGVQVLSFSIGTNGQVTFAGTAATRQNLLDFEQALRTDGFFQDLKLPLSDILHETNIHFTFEGVLREQYRL